MTEVEEFRNATNPGEAPEAAMLRKIKMHEFLMTGGVRLDYDKRGIMQYGPPVTVASHPICPWHGEDCPAWKEIVEGRGHWTRMEAEMEALMDDLAGEPVTTEEADEILDRVNKLREQLEWRPRDAKTLRERTPEQFEAERREAKMAKAAQKLTITKPKKKGVYAAAGKKTGGNPWDRGEERDYFKPMFQVEDDSRNDAVAAFAGEALPDVIEIDGDEGEEGDE